MGNCQPQDNLQVFVTVSGSMLAGSTASLPHLMQVKFNAYSTFIGMFQMVYHTVFPKLNTTSPIFLIIIIIIIINRSSQAETYYTCNWLRKVQFFTKLGAWLGNGQHFAVFKASHHY